MELSFASFLRSSVRTSSDISSFGGILNGRRIQQSLDSRSEAGPGSYANASLNSSAIKVLVFAHWK